MPVPSRPRVLIIGAGLAPNDITVPIRWVLRNERNATVLLTEGPGSARAPTMNAGRRTGKAVRFK